MTLSKEERYSKERQRIPTLVDEGGISQEDADAILEFVNAKDPDRVSVTDPTEDNGKAVSTLASYAYKLRRISNNVEYDLVEATPNQLNQTFDDLRQGHVEWVKDDGLADGTVRNFQTTLRKFYEYHSELGIEKEEIALLPPQDTSVDERDLYEKEEIQAIREAARHPRDKALVDLLLYTGQRYSAIRNLRLKDVDPDEGVLYLNEEAGQLKGASGKRPLLYAEKAVRDWYNQHPCRGDRDAYFITHRHDWQTDRMTIGDPLDHSSIHRILQTIGERAGVDKPMNAHNFRHTFVTICKRDYGMDNDTIKRLIGHRPDSNIMETTYAHLTDDDVIAAAERATDIRDDESDSPLTPDVCDVCGEVIEHENAKACPGCGTVFTPDAKSAQDKVQDDVKESYKQTEPGSETQEKLDKLDQLLDDPNVKAALLEKLNDK